MDVKKTFALLLTLALLLGCGPAHADAMTLAGLETSESIVWEGNSFWDSMREATGVSVEARAYSDEAEWNAKKAKWLAGEGELPEILFKARLSTLEEKELLDAGVLVDLAPYLEEYAPNLWKIFQARPEWLDAVRLADGRIASLPALSGAERECCLWINASFMEKLELSQPNDIEEYTEALRAIRDGDPNGNGKRDETPLSLCGPWEAKFLLHAFGLVADDYNLCTDEAGTVRYAPFAPEYREFVEWLKAALDEGLINSDAFRTTPAARETSASLTDEKTPQTVGSLVSLAPFMQLRSADTTSYEAIVLEHDGERALRELVPAVSRGTFAVTSACGDIAAALKFVDFLYTEEGGRLAFAGREGMEYTLQPDGTWKWNVSDYTGLAALMAASVMAGDGLTPGLEPAAFERNGEIAVDNYVRRQTDSVREYFRAALPPTHAVDAQSEARIAELQAQLGPCVDTAIANFAMGITPLDDAHWNAFLEELSALGAEEMCALWQARLDARTETH